MRLKTGSLTFIGQSHLALTRFMARFLIFVLGSSGLLSGSGFVALPGDVCPTLSSTESSLSLVLYLLQEKSFITGQNPVVIIDRKVERSSEA